MAGTNAHKTASHFQLSMPNTTKNSVEITIVPTAPQLNLIQDVSLNGVKVLLAEDNELNAELAITLLEEAGMHVTRAVDGQDAVACFANNPADT